MATLNIQFSEQEIIDSVDETKLKRELTAAITDLRNNIETAHLQGKKVERLWGFLNLSESGHVFGVGIDVSIMKTPHLIIYFNLNNLDDEEIKNGKFAKGFYTNDEHKHLDSSLQILNIFRDWAHEITLKIIEGDI